MKINGKDSARTPIKTTKTKKKNSLNRKESPVSPLEEEEDIDLDKQFAEEDECFWLSSSSSSPNSSFFREYKFSSSLRLSVDDWLISWLSTLADPYLHLDNADKKKHKNTETDFPEVSDSENSKFSSDSESYEYCDCSNYLSVKNSSEEPLFWPSDWKSDWSSPETWKCFSMSPRKGTTTSDSLEFGSGSSQFSSNNIKKMINPEESRLGNYSAKISTRKADEEMEEESKCVYTDLLEDDMRKNGEESIETVMGLEEFDGHEGVESEFNDEVFSMDDDV